MYAGGAGIPLVFFSRELIVLLLNMFLGSPESCWLFSQIMLISGNESHLIDVYMGLSLVLGLVFFHLF